MKRYVSSFLWVFLCLSMTRCSTQQRSSSSSTSEQASETKAYEAVVMISLPEGRGICTGTVVSENAILTAAHCVLTSGRYLVKTQQGYFTTSERHYLGQGVLNSPDDLGLLIFKKEKIAVRSEGNVVYNIANHVQSGDKVDLVGYGCNDLHSRTGSGKKRQGSNLVARVNDYIEFDTPDIETSSSTIRGILGPQDQAGSCFGDSGGPALREISKGKGQYEIVGVTHAGGSDGVEILSQYVNVASDDSNRRWLSEKNLELGLGIEGL